MKNNRCGESLCPQGAVATLLPASCRQPVQWHIIWHMHPRALPKEMNQAQGLESGGWGSIWKCWRPPVE